MNWDRVEGNWKEFKGKVQQKWGKLTNDDLDVVEGKRKQLSGRLQQRYGYAPWLLESFVEKAQHRGTSYRASNWIELGEVTAGRGRTARNSGSRSIAAWRWSRRGSPAQRQPPRGGSTANRGTGRRRHRRHRRRRPDRCAQRPGR